MKSQFVAILVAFMLLKGLSYNYLCIKISLSGTFLFYFPGSLSLKKDKETQRKLRCFQCSDQKGSSKLKKCKGNISFHIFPSL